MMIGEAQKAAVIEVTSDLSAAVAGNSPWGTLATATVERGLRAKAKSDKDRFLAARAGDAALYRSEVARAAAGEERERAARAASAEHESGGRRRRRSSGGTVMSGRRASGTGAGGCEESWSSTSGRAAASSGTHPLLSPGTPPLGTLPPLLSPFYGPHALAGVSAAVEEGGSGRTVVGGLPRLPSHGPLNVHTQSSVRAPYMAERVREGDGAGLAAAAAIKERGELERVRLAAGEAATAAARTASRRGSAAGQSMREPKEALLALQVMEDLSREARGSQWRGGFMPCARSRASSVGSVGGKSAASRGGGGCFTGFPPSRPTLQPAGNAELGDGVESSEWPVERGLAQEEDLERAFIQAMEAEM